jgi:hypothetical protein
VETKQLVDSKENITDSLKPSLKPSNLKSIPLKKQSGYASVFMLKLTKESLRKDTNL